MSQCRSPGSTIWQWGCAKRSWQNPNASSIALGAVKFRGFVVIRTTALNTTGDKPKKKSPVRAPDAAGVPGRCIIPFLQPREIGVDAVEILPDRSAGEQILLALKPEEAFIAPSGARGRH